MYINEAGWVAIGFLVFLILAWKFASKPISDTLEQRGNEVRKKLKEAEELRSEANKLLQKYKALKLEAEKDAELLLKKAEKTAVQMKVHAEKVTKETLKQKEEQVLNKIKAAETQAILDIKNLTVELAIRSSEEILKSQITPKTAKKLIEESVKKIN